MDFLKLLDDTKNENSPPKHVLYENISKGTSIRVIGLEGSLLNVYKGYIGEVRDYRRGQDYALVTLMALNNGNLLKMPLEHFQLLEVPN
jgi:hypothetical protein